MCCACFCTCVIWLSSKWPHILWSPPAELPFLDFFFFEKKSAHNGRCKTRYLNNWLVWTQKHPTLTYVGWIIFSRKILLSCLTSPLLRESQNWTNLWNVFLRKYISRYFTRFHKSHSRCSNICEYCNILWGTIIFIPLLQFVFKYWTWILHLFVMNIDVDERKQMCLWRNYNCGQL